ncbi:MAG: hypothetical protein Kow00108_00980 [Calditrichia bacterium]
MTHKKKIIFILLIIIGNITVGFGQYKGTPNLSGVGMPYFEADFITSFDQDSSTRFQELILQILNDDLTFVATDSGFTAKIEIEISAVKDGDIVYNNTIRKQYIEKDFVRTNSRTIKQTIIEKLYLEPAKYQFVILFRDMFTQQKIKRTFEKEIVDWKNNTLAMSSLLFYSEINKIDGKILPASAPNILKNFNDDNPNIYVNFKIFSSDTVQPVRLTIQLISAEKWVEREYSSEIKIHNALQDYWFKIKKENLEKSIYNLNIQISQGEKRISRVQGISFFWSEAPTNISSLDKALEQMRYIVTGDTLGKLKRMSYQSKKEFFKSFWKQMDPDPTTKKNELMDEYFKRVNYANYKFSATGKDGWETDRGRIFIKFGPPDEIDNYSTQFNEDNYQIWRYYNLKKEFLFIDRTGFGYYELHPDYFTVEYSD